MSDNGFRVLQAALRIATLVNDLIDRAPRGRLIYVAQLRDSAGGIPGNISEGLGRRRGPERTYKFEVARVEAKETLSRLQPNFDTGRIRASDYWPVRNLAETVIKMLDSLITHG